MKRIVAVTGHYGSGKTEFSVNLALRQAAAGERVTLADLDIVNPYFRSREKRSLLEAAGVTVIGSSTGSDTGADLPALSPQVHGALRNEDIRTILDVGGDAVGARLLGRYKHFLSRDNLDLLIVVNTSRPETQDVEGVRDHVRAIQEATVLQATGLVNNSHMLEFTQAYHLERGQEVCRAVADELEIPIAYLAAREAVLDQLSDELRGERISIGMHLRESWMYVQ
jgi:hypothetical protein